MAKLILSGATSGSISLESPAVSGTTTLTLPATTSTLAINGPAFSAIASEDQTVSFSTTTKINITSEIFDTNSNYDTGNSRFTPTIAGYYQVNGVLAASGSTTMTRALVFLFKNGTEYTRGEDIRVSFSGGTSVVTFSEVLYMNGSTDYIELYGFITGSGTATFEDTSGSKSRFSAVLVRGA